MTEKERKIRDLVARVEPLVQEFIMKAPQFEGDVDLARQIGQAMGELVGWSGAPRRTS